MKQLCDCRVTHPQTLEDQDVEKIEGNSFPSSLEVRKKLCVLEQSSPVNIRRNSLSSVKG